MDREHTPCACFMLRRDDHPDSVHAAQQLEGRPPEGVGPTPAGDQDYVTHAC